MFWVRFTERAREVIFYAQEEAVKLRDRQVGTEHLLLGIVREPDSIAAVVLTGMGVDLKRIRKEVKRLTSPNVVGHDMKLELGWRAKRAIDLAYNEARKLNNRYIGTEHLLLGLIREGDGLAAQILSKLGVRYATALEAVKAVQEQSAGSDEVAFTEQPAHTSEPEGKRQSTQTATSYSIDPQLVRTLIAQALSARASAYAPYSRYEVGAAVLVDEDQIYSGCNVENASYGLSVCAERVAIFNAVVAGKRHLKAAAVATRDGGTPCGACRQVLSEFADDPTACLIILVKPDQEYETCTLAELLPKPFDF